MNAARVASLIKASFTDRSFGIGLVAVAAVCGALSGIGMVNGEDAVKKRLDAMPAHTVLIEWNTAPLLRPANMPPPAGFTQLEENPDITVETETMTVADAATPHTEGAGPENTTTIIDTTEPNPYPDDSGHEDSAPRPPENQASVQDAATPEHAGTIQADSDTHDPAVDTLDDSAGATPVVIEQVADLPPVPFDGLYESTPEGKLPTIRTADGMTPFKAYRTPFDRASAGDKPIVSIGVYNMGLSDSATEAAMRTLPKEVALVMSPYLTAPEFWEQQARERGHEIWMTLPVESEDYPLTDPGPHTALIGAGERDNIAKLNWVMARLPAYVGFVSGQHPQFLKSQNDMRPYLGAIYKRGLAFFDGSENPSLIPQTMAQGMNAPYSTIDVWIDSNAGKEDIAASLARIEQLAKEQGYVAAMIRPYPLSYQMVQDWIKTLPSKGIVLAPLSAQTGT